MINIIFLILAIIIDLLKYEEIVNKYSEEYAIVVPIDYGLFEKACLLRGISSFLIDI